VEVSNGTALNNTYENNIIHVKTGNKLWLP
jgi:hypothetical protein